MATLPMTLSGPKPPHTTTISTFCVAFHIFVAGRNFKIGMWIERSKCHPM